MTFDDVVKGFKKWPEKTSTSPSGRHLGVYKTLLKDQHHEKPGEPVTTKGIDLMQDIHRLIILALKHTHTFKRWQTIWNLYLEKDPGRPYINRLRTLHLIEADLNLIWKWHSSKGFMQRAEQNQSLSDAQYGGRAGHSAIDLACQRVATFEIYRLTRTTAIEKGLDVAECFDRTIETCQNLSCIQNGANPEYIRLHAQTRNLLQYHVKHAYGVSSNYNQHSSTNPWHGSGQGTGDAAARWIVQANSMIKAYQSRTAIFPLHSPNKHHQLPLSIDAFMDDTWLPAPNLTNSTLPEIAAQAQTNLQLWHDILQSSGGQLNPKKCVWMLFHWIHKPSGEAKINVPPNPPIITTTITGAEPYAIR